MFRLGRHRMHDYFRSQIRILAVFIHTKMTQQDLEMDLNEEDNESDGLVKIKNNKATSCAECRRQVEGPINWDKLRNLHAGSSSNALECDRVRLVSRGYVLGS